MRRSHTTAKLCAVILVLALLFMTSGTIFAASTTQTGSPFIFTTDQTLSTITVENRNQTDVTASFNIVTSTQWVQSAVISATYDDNLVRQGRHLDPVLSYGYAADGFMVIKWSLTNLSFSWTDTFGSHSIDGPDLDIAASGAVPLTANDQSRSYHLETAHQDLLVEAPDSPYVALWLAADVTVTSHGIETLRHAEIGGNAVPSDAPLYLGPSATDDLFVPCTLGAGDDLVYALGDLSTNQDIDVVTSLVVDVGMNAGVLPFPHDAVSFATPSFELGSASKNFDVTAPGMTFNLGEVLPNNIPPTAVTVDFYEGFEGSPITFDGSLSKSVCGILPTLKWEFSDGGVEYGATPHHVFQAPGPFTGQLTATDLTGLTASKTFSIEVKNLPPIAKAGPDMSTKWGIPVKLQGSGLNPGTFQQPLLSYMWSFGDGTPSASGGAIVTHTYDMPGTFEAQLVVTDPGWLFDTDTAIIEVSKRLTNLGYFGPLTSSSSQIVPLKAVLKDEFGNPLEGRSVVFTLSNLPLIQPPVTALTDSNGVAIYNLKLKLKAGTYPLNVVFAPVPGSTDIIKYEGSSTSAIFKIGKK